MATTLLIVFIFGLCIGSFLNVCIYRVPEKMSVALPQRSFCPSCKQQLTWKENVPVVSWLMLRGRCRSCREPISGRYPLVELLSGFAAAASVIRYGLTPTAAIVYALTATLIVITFIDLKFKKIPNIITFPGMTLGLCLGIISQYSEIFSPPVTQGALDTLLGMLAGGGFFFAIAYVYFALTKEFGLGMGDVKLMGVTGAVLGLKSVVPIIFAGSFFGAAFGLLLIAFGGGSRKSEIPFGPWLSLGAVLYLFVDIPLFRIL